MRQYVNPVLVLLAMNKRLKIQFIAATLLLLNGTAVSCAEPANVSETRMDLMKESEIAERKLAVVVFGGGCFWCTEAIFQRCAGVVEVVPGYAGGTVVNPTYEQVVTGRTGHAEVVRVVYDPREISLGDLLNLFWLAHDPTSLNRQGADVGTQYRSAIYYTTDAAGAQIRQLAKELNESGQFSDPIVTEIAPLQVFYPAELYHYNYFRDNPDAGYCRYVIAPKLKKLGFDE